MSIRDKLRILVVDDMSTSRGVLTQSLEALGVQNISTAENGLEALQILAKSPVHLVISDYNMPEMDGLHLLQHIRNHRKMNPIGFILVTGRTERKIVELGTKLGMNNFMKKPFGTHDLKKCIEAVVGAL